MRHLALLALLCAPTSAAAYELIGASWHLADYPSGVPYCPIVNARNAVTNSAKQAFGAAVDGAMLAWTADGDAAQSIPAVPCSAYKANKTTCTGSPNTTDQQNWIFWETDWSSIPGVGTDTIGVTPSWFSGGDLLTAKVIFNDRDYTWTTDGSGTDVGSIAVHELGHFVGLDHYDSNDPAKQQACGDASPPSVMCSFYSGGEMRIPTADDILGVCYLYPIAGAMGSACADGSTCDSGVCHAEGYCTQSCPPDCPLGYDCQSGECSRSQPAPTCPVCGTLPCVSGSVCVGSSGPAICTKNCSGNGECPLDFFCASSAGGGGVCWPLANRCGTGPAAGDACVGENECGFGNICIQLGGGGSQCFGTCRAKSDCADPTALCQSVDTDIGYCTVGSAVCACDTADGCQAGCPCDPGCSCTCDTTAGCDANCSCDPDCACACNVTRDCDAGCGCDPDCACLCDVSANCDPGCEACDPECGGCNCGTLFPNHGLLSLIDAALLVGAGLVLAAGRFVRRHRPSWQRPVDRAA